MWGTALPIMTREQHGHLTAPAPGLQLPACPGARLLPAEREPLLCSRTLQAHRARPSPGAPGCTATARGCPGTDPGPGAPAGQGRGRERHRAAGRGGARWRGGRRGAGDGRRGGESRKGWAGGGERKKTGEEWQRDRVEQRQRRRWQGGALGNTAISSRREGQGEEKSGGKEDRGTDRHRQGEDTGFVSGLWL